MITKKTSSKIAQYLLETKAVTLQPNDPFTWASGWKSPIYCDNRTTLSHPEVRTFIKEKLAKHILKEFEEVEVIAGVATAGIPQGALVADMLDLPFIYVRPEPKKHGLQNQIEGKLREGQKVVLVEDLISTGGSSLKAADAVRQAGGEVLGLAAIFTYGFAQAQHNFEKAHCAHFTLSNYNELIEVAQLTGYVKNDDLKSLLEWREQPDKWGQ